MTIKPFFTIGLLLVCASAYSQLASKLKVDGKGAVVASPLLTNDNISSSLKIDVDIQPPISVQEKIVSILLGKLDTTLFNLRNDNSSFKKFYIALWGETTYGDVINDLNNLKFFLKSNGTVKGSYTYLQSVENNWIKLFTTDPSKWYTLNGNPFATPLALDNSNYNNDKKSYQVKLIMKNLFNQSLVDLFNSSYSGTEIASLATLSIAEFYLTKPKEWQGWLDVIKKLSAKPVEDIDDAFLDKTAAVHHSVDVDDVIKVFRDAPYFKLWIWYRKGALTINPFEIIAADTAKTSAGVLVKDPSMNISILEELRQTTICLNDIRVINHSKNDEDLRYLQFSTQEPFEGSDNKSELSHALLPKEKLHIAIHNVALDRVVNLKETKSTTLNGLVGPAFWLDSALNVAGGLTSLLTTGTGIWGKIIGVFSSTAAITNKAKGVQVTDSYSLSFSKTQNASKVSAFYDAIEEDLKKNNTYNDFFYKKTLTTFKQQNNYDHKIAIAIAKKDLSQIESLRIDFLDAYESEFDKVKAGKTNLQNDSLILEVLLSTIKQSNPAPVSVVANTAETAFLLRTEVTTSNAFDEESKKTFEISTARKKDGKLMDTSSVASFTFKTGRKYLFLTSAGIGFTFPNPYYGQNSVTPQTDGSYKITTTRETVRMVVGLHIYPWRLFLQDPSFFTSKSSPYYTRLSVFVGVGIPDPLKYYYPGIGFDIFSGIKLIGGPQLYLYDKYKIENNQVVKSQPVVRCSGPYFSINVDPMIVLKALNLFK